MSRKQSSQDILQTVWSGFKEVLKYLLLYLIFYAVSKLLIIEVIKYDNEGLVAGVALLFTLVAYFFVKRRTT